MLKATFVEVIKWLVGVGIYLVVFWYGRTKINARERTKRLRR